MACNDKQDGQSSDILQPEILAKEELIKVLIEKKVNISNPDSLSKDTLVEQFYKSVVPMPQRKYRHNRRGQEMTKNQNQRAKLKRSHAQMAGTEQLNLGTPGKSTSGPKFMASYAPEQLGDRLKPPPSAINFDHKVIKLGGNDSTKHSVAESGKEVTHLSKETVNSDSAKTSNPKFSAASCKKSGIVRLSGVSDISKSESISETESEKIVIKTFTKTLPSVSSETQNGKSEDKLTVKITKILPHKKDAVPTRIRIKRPDSQVYSTLVSQTEMDHSQLGEESNSSHKSEESEDDIATPISQTTSPESPSEEGVVTKKFKRINVKWP